MARWIKKVSLGRSDDAKPGFDVDQAGNDGRLGGVGMAGVAVALGDNAEPLGAPDAVLDGNADTVST